MKTLSVVSQKGGVGKTTLATALAVEAIRNGQNVVVFDLDPQASASFWKDTRNDETLAMTAVPAARLSHVLKAAADAGCDLAIIDTPPLAKDIAFEAVEAADFVLVPTKPAVLDIMAMTRTLELVRHSRSGYGVVLNCCPAQGKEIEDSEAALIQMQAVVCPIRVGNRIAFSRAQQTGQAAQEIEPEGKAAKEIQQLYAYVCMNINKHEQRSESHGRKRAASRA